MTVADVERIGTPEITRQDARKAFIEYKRAVVSETDSLRKHEYDALMRGYKAIAAGQSVIDQVFHDSFKLGVVRVAKLNRMSQYGVRSIGS